MRGILKQCILENSEKLIQDLIKFVKENKEYVKNYKNIPKYEGPI